MTKLTFTDASDESSEEERYDSPKNSVWVLAVAEDGSTSVLKPANIHYSFFDNGPGCGDIGLPEDLNLPAGVYRVTCTFSASSDWETGYVDDYSFEPNLIDPLWVLN
jgi:hypothetical protein